MFKISLISGAQTAIAGANIICTLVGFVLSIICVRKKETIEKYKIKRYDEKIQKMLEKTLRGGEIAFIKQTEWIRQL